jgi:hypothetical protein
MANKMQFNPLASTGVSKYIAPGSVDVSGFTVGFLTVGSTSGGTDVLKPVSKKEFVESNEDRFETKSQAVKDYYRNLHLFTSAAQADFNKGVTGGMRVAMVRKAESGRRSYTLFAPKSDTGSNGVTNTKLVEENTKLKAQLDKMMNVLKASGLLEETVAAE